MSVIDSDTDLYVTQSSNGFLRVGNPYKSDVIDAERDLSECIFLFLRSFKLNIVNITAINASPDGQFIVLATSDSIKNENKQNEICIRVYSIDKTIIKETIIDKNGISTEFNTVNEPKLSHMVKMSDAGKIRLNNNLPIS